MINTTLFVIKSFIYPFSLNISGDIKMTELKFKIPGSLKGEVGKIEKDVDELISSEKKRKSLSVFMDEIMKGAKQLKEEELVKLGRVVKKGRFGKLKKMGLA